MNNCNFIGRIGKDAEVSSLVEELTNMKEAA